LRVQPRDLRLTIAEADDRVGRPSPTDHRNDTWRATRQPPEEGRPVRLLSITEWLPGYRRSDLRFDIVAGITVAALVVPKALGYAGIALIPIQNGLYAAAAGALLYALFGTSRQISTGPSSALAAVAASAVVTSELPSDEAPQLVAAVTLVTGLLFVVLAVLKMGWISRFLSKAVITGFLFGAAIEVVVGELPKLAGTDTEGKNAWQEFADFVGGFDGRHTATMVVGVVSLAVILAGRFVVPKLPGALALVIGGLLASNLFDLADRGVATVGDVPRGLPAPELPGISVFTEHTATIATAALALVLIGFSQTVGDARMFAARHDYRIRVDNESVAQGLANIGSGAFQGMPVSTSLSASSLADSSGARTQMASVVTGVVVLLTLLIFAPVFSDLPKPVLGAIIIDAVVFGMMDVAQIRRLWRISRFDFWIAILAIIGVLTAGVLAGVIIGIILSLGWLVYVNAKPPLRELARRPGTTTFRALEDFPTYETYDGLLIVRFDGGMYFVTSEVFVDQLRERLESAGTRIERVVIDFESVNFLDSQGASELDRLVQAASDRDISLRFARLKTAIRATLDADGVTARLGEDRIHTSIDDAVTAALAEVSTR
jgi:SulP family sulfate permease